MAGIEVRADFVEEEQIILAGGDATFLWLRMACRVARERTHGSVPSAWVNEYNPRRGRHLAARLIQVGLWDRHGDHYLFLPAPFLKIRQRPFYRRRTPASLRKAIIERDGQCQRCGTTENLTVDHIHPVSLGGTDVDTNLQALCGPCNSRKGNRWSG